MNQILKPCPYCGNTEPNLIDNRVEWYVKCDKCKPFATVVYGESVMNEVDHENVDPCQIDWDRVKQTAIDAWNRRK